MKFSVVLLSTALLSATNTLAALCNLQVQYYGGSSSRGQPKINHKLVKREIPEDKVDRVIANMYIESNGKFSGSRIDGGVKVTYPHVAADNSAATTIIDEMSTMISRIV